MPDLIDRKQISARIADQWYLWEDEYDIDQVLGDIEDAPAVDAIPVDWLLQQGKTAYASDTVEYIREVEQYNKTITDLIDKWRSEREEE